MLDKDVPKEEHGEVLFGWGSRSYGTYDSVENDDVFNLSNAAKPINPNSTFNCDTKSQSFLRRLWPGSCLKVDYITLAILVVLIWALLYTLLQQEVQPGGQLFALIMLTASSYLCGWLISFLQLPPLLGMILCGIAMRNIGFFEITGIYSQIVATLREIALTVIVILAGLGLDAVALKKLSLVVARLALVPCFTEAIAAAVAAHVITGMPWLWGLLLGFALSAISPAIIVPSLLDLKEKGYGEGKGISTLIMAACSVDDVVCISIFGVLIGLIFSEGDLLFNLTHGPIETVIGLSVGIGWGFLCGFVPHRSENHLVLKRSLMVGVGGVVCVLGSEMIGYSGAGPMAAVIQSFLASLLWKSRGWSTTYNPVEDVFSALWNLFEPLLFGLIGAEINFNFINLQVVGRALAVLAFCTVIRVATCCLILTGANLNTKEIIFVNFAWIPKATIQAALGPVALDLAKKNNREDVIPWAQDILTIVVLSILLTAPAGAIGIAVGGPRLLTKGSLHGGEKSDQNSKTDLIESPS